MTQNKLRVKGVTTGGGTTTTTTTLSQLITFTKANYGTDVDVVSQYLTLKRADNQGLFNTNEGNTYTNTYQGGKNHLWLTEPLVVGGGEHGPISKSYWISNLWNTFDSSTINISQLVENYSTLSPGVAVPQGFFNDKSMVPWAVVHGDAPLSMLNKEAIMLDVLDQKFYKVKFTQWTSGNAGGGLSYTRELIS